MAVWQVKLRLVAPLPAPPTWSGWPGLPGLSRDLCRLFGQEAPGQEWEEYLHWGDFDRHDASLLLDDEEDVALRVRVDLRRPDRAFVRRLAETLAIFGLRLEMGDRLVDPSEENIAAIVRSSDAMRFMVDPVKFLWG